MFSFTTLLLLLATAASSAALEDATKQHVVVDAAADATTPTSHHLRGGRELDTEEDDTTICYETAGAYKDYFCETFKTLSDGTSLQLKHKILRDTDADDETPFCIGWGAEGVCNTCYAPGESGYPCAVGVNDITYDCSNLSTDLCAKVDCAGNCVNVETGQGGVSCFSGATLVTVKSKGTIPMHALELGDEVLTDSTTGTYAPVYSFGHREESNVAKFLQLLPSKIELSENHMVFVDSGKAIPASTVKVGDILSSGQEVTGIKTVIRQGAFAPFTSSGTIVVNGVQASNYITLQENSGTIMIGPFSTGLSFHWLAHVSQIPHRTWCSIATACTEDAYNENGISKWVDLEHRFFKWLLHPNNAIVMALLIIPLLLVLGALAAMDFMLLSATSSYPVAVVGTLAALALLISRRATPKPKMV
jgi:hypothetical protein